MRSIRFGVVTMVRYILAKARIGDIAISITDIALYLE
jgi:hypothetical protein